jgi:hypothetical protein
MSLLASSYFDHLRSYISGDYFVDDGSSGKITLKEKYFKENATRPSLHVVELGFLGKAFAIKLDGRPERLFHFLDDNGKQWSKRCDFVVFQCHRTSINAYLIEFKTKGLDPQSIIDQLKAGIHWCACLRRAIRQYTGDDRSIKARKFVFSANDDPSRFLDPNGKYLARDPSIRHYHYRDLSGLMLDGLENTSINLV